MLLLVRHGATSLNEEGLLLGRLDPELSARGAAQARALAGWIVDPDVVISSPLRRARQTAALLSHDVVVDERWTELDYGPYDGRSPGAIPSGAWQRWRADPAASPRGVESLLDLGARVRNACEALRDVAASGVVVVVSHVSPIKAALAWALDAPIGISWRMYVEDASVSRIDFGSDGAIVRWFNRGVFEAD